MVTNAGHSEWCSSKFAMHASYVHVKLSGLRGAKGFNKHAYLGILWLSYNCIVCYKYRGQIVRHWHGEIEERERGKMKKRERERERERERKERMRDRQKETTTNRNK